MIKMVQNVNYLMFVQGSGFKNEINFKKLGYARQLYQV